jgi:hypothetical protein
MSDLAVILGGLVALVLGILGFGQVQKRSGRKEAEDEAEKADTERALDIRARADRADERLRRFDDAGFRD